MKKLLLFINMLLLGFVSNAQVLYHDTFDTYPLGPITTDITGNTPGYGGWFVRSTSRLMRVIPNNVYDITPEAGKGNVFVTGTLNAYYLNATTVIFDRNDINALWQNRTIGNNIMLVEYDIWMTPNAQTGFLHHQLYINGDDSAYGLIISTNDFETNTLPATSCLMYFFYKQFGTPSSVTVPLGHNGTREFKKFPFGKWFTVKLYIEYLYQGTTKTGIKAHIFIPDLYILKSVTLNAVNETDVLDDVYRLFFGGSGELPLNATFKYDNIKITALQQMPDLKANVDAFISQKFTIYPNPASNLVSITNNDNLSVQEVTIYDMAGKQLSTQTFKNEAEVQLNVAHLASGTYILHIQTTEGTAVKQLVKK